MSTDILVTAFMPFGGDEINPTEIILERLPDDIEGHKIRKLLLPVEFNTAALLACEEFDRISPKAVIMLGQAGGRSMITPEAVGKNIMNARIPDSSGYKPEDLPIVRDGEDMLYSTLPLDKIVGEVNALGIPCGISRDAGEYVCNSLLYGMLYHNKGRVPTGFIHVPFIREQGHEDKPFMELDDIYRGIDAALRCVICAEGR